jgi:hypothetical protein
MKRPLLMDCGRISKVTRGLTEGVFLEGAPPPWNLRV